MSRNYFTREDSWKRFFFVRGLTADEFYTDGGLKLNIEQLTHLELKISGYERIVFYDKDNKLYCYDDESFRLIHARGAEGKENSRPTRAVLRKRGGLKRGKHAKFVSSSAPKQPEEQPEETQTEEPENTVWKAGEKSGVMIRNIGSGILHMGMQDTEFIKRQIDAYMRDAEIRTAIVINDPDAFLKEFGSNPMHSLTAVYERLGTENENIMVFLFTDDNLVNLYQPDQIKMDESKDGNVIDIMCPNAAELRNMLMYFRTNYDLKLRMRDLDASALALFRGIRMSKKSVRIKTLNKLLKQFGTEQYLTPDRCYELLGQKKPVSAAEQLNRLIGMENIKKALAGYSTGNIPVSENMDQTSASRLRPDLSGVKSSGEMIHFVLTGRPGTGKTTVANLIGQLFYEMGYLESGHVVEADRALLVGEHVGETAIKTRRKVEEAFGGVLFIDEAYTLKRRNDTGNDFGQEAIDTLVKLMDQYKGKFIVVAAGYPDEMKIFLNSNPGLASRFKTLNIEDYTVAEMQQIVEFHAARNHAVLSDELRSHLPDFCENWVNLAGENWGNAREAVKLIDDMMNKYKNDPDKETVTTDDGEKYLLQIRHLPDDKMSYLKPVSQMREEILAKLNAMTGLSEAKKTIEKLRIRMIMGHQQMPGHYIFVGNPGTGKTTMARYMGQILRNLNMLKRGHLIEYTASDLMTEVFNDDNRGDFTKVANKALDGVLFIDEAYMLGSDTTGRGRAILNAILPYMENNKDRISIIFAGYEDEIDNLIRTNPGFKGRFTDTIYFENYSGEELYGILLDMLKERGIETDAEYRENALRALCGYVNSHSREKDFGNARYVRNEFIPACLDVQSSRLYQTYGESIPDEMKKQLTGTDIPANLVKFIMIPVRKPDTRSASEKMESMIGCENIKKALREIQKMAEFNRTNELGITSSPEKLHWVLEGNPGTGKTTIANLIGQVYKECGILESGRVFKVTRSDLVAEYMGQTAPKTRRWINRAMGGVLFIDEAYALTKSEPEGGGYGAEAITELVEAMEAHKGEFAVICAGYPDDMEEFLKSNDGLASRMRKFMLEDYTGEELTRIFLMKCRENETTVDDELKEKLSVFFDNMKSRSSKTEKWGNGREAENLLTEMLHDWMDNQKIHEDESGHRTRLLTVEHIPEEKKRFLIGKPKKKEAASSAVDEINSLIGFDEVKSRLLDLLALKKAADETGRDDLLDDLNLHWVLRGNPGTGKTTVAKLIGKVYKEMGLLRRGHTKKVTRRDLVSEHVGGTAIKTQKAIDAAMGGVLFIDEAYTLKRAVNTGNDFGQEAIDILLEQMSDLNGEFAVIAAGYPKEMQVFLDSNPGFASRFDKDFVLRDYTADELLKIFEIKCNAKKFWLDDETKDTMRAFFANMIAAKLKNWANGREAENLERNMRMNWAKNPVTRIDPVTNEKRSYYTADHIPENQKKYLPRKKKEGELEGVPALSPVDEDNYVIDPSGIPPVEKSYSYDQNYMKQVDSVVFIKASSAAGEGSGSGSVITKDGCILTCHHVIRDAEKVTVRFKAKENNIEKTIWKDAEIIWADPELDAAILKTDYLGCEPLPIRPLSNETKVGESIYHWGYPFGERLSDNLDDLQPSLFQGYISSIQVKNALERVNTNMEAKRGCSGGPVFSKEDGSIIGILCGSQTVGGDGLVEEINYVLPVKYIWLRAVGTGK